MSEAKKRTAKTTKGDKKPSNHHKDVVPKPPIRSTQQDDHKVKDHGAVNTTGGMIVKTFTISLFLASAVWVGTIFLKSATPSVASEYEESSDKYVTCGSAIKLAHVETGRKFYLDSGEQSYGSGSGQQIVTLKPEKNDHSSLWLAREGHGEPQCNAGEPIHCNTVIRLTHVETGKNLHSHHFRSPITNQQEVSGYGNDGEGDDGDNFRVVCVGAGEGDGAYWRRSKAVGLQHVKSMKYLTAQANADFNARNCGGRCPIMNHLECVVKSSFDKNAQFTATLGVHLSK